MVKKYIFSTCAAAVLLLPTFVQAQIVNCNAFIKGNYLEAGVNWNGSFGSSTPPPSGYHPKMQSTLFNAAACGGSSRTDSAIGFVADPEKNGWYTGTVPAFGDYVLPGSCQEGWSYMANGTQTDAWNQRAASSDSIGNGMTSSFMSYTDSGYVRRVKTQAIADGVYITQIYSIDSGKLFISCEVLIENTNLATVNNVLYMRTINPHNDQLLSSIGATKNKIEHALPDSLNRTVISTRGTVHTDAYLALATQDPRVVGFIYKNAGLPTSTTIDNIAGGDANYMYLQNDSNQLNTSIGLIFDLGSLVSGAGARINFIYAFHPSVIDSTLNTIDSHLVVRNVDPNACSLYPNPATSGFRIKGMQEGDVISIFDMMGRKVSEPSTGSNHYFSTGELIPGHYVVVITDKYGMAKARLPLQK